MRDERETEEREIWVGERKRLRVHGTGVGYNQREMSEDYKDVGPAILLVLDIFALGFCRSRHLATSMN